MVRYHRNQSVKIKRSLKEVSEWMNDIHDKRPGILSQNPRYIGFINHKSELDILIKEREEILASPCIATR